MAVLATQTIGITGVAPSFTAASGGGDSAAPGDTHYLHVKNGGGSSVTVTVVVPGTEYGQARADVPVAVPAAGERLIGPLSPELRNPSTNKVDITYSGVTTVTVGVFAI
jgi:hypothetical protein